MLALTRRSGEEIVIIDRESGEQIGVAVVEHKGHQIRIGIEAPQRFEIVRRELLDRKLAAVPA